jgi:hypothetical protein
MPSLSLTVMARKLVCQRGESEIPGLKKILGCQKDGESHGARCQNYKATGFCWEGMLQDELPEDSSLAQAYLGSFRGIGNIMARFTNRAARILAASLQARSLPCAGTSPDLHVILGYHNGDSLRFPQDFEFTENWLEFHLDDQMAIKTIGWINFDAPIQEEIPYKKISGDEKEQKDAMNSSGQEQIATVPGHRAIMTREEWRSTWAE